MTVGDHTVKHKAVKIRRLFDNKVVVGFAGGAADALALMERFETKLKDFQGNVVKACTELAKLWRTDRLLRHLQSQMIVSDGKTLLLVTGNGEVLSPDDGVIGIGSGGPFAVAAARAMVRHGGDMDIVDLVRSAMEIAAELCVYTNSEITVEEMP